MPQNADDGCIVSRCRSGSRSTAIISIAIVVVATISGLAATRAQQGYIHSLRSMTFAIDDNATLMTPNNTTNMTRDHPHAGARDADGNCGYIADVTAVRRLMMERYQRRLAKELANASATAISFLPFRSSAEKSAVCDKLPKEGPEKRAGFRLLTAKVRVSESKPSDLLVTPRRRLLCVVHTHSKKKEQISAIAETWGWRCDGFFAASTITVTDPNKSGFGSIDLPHLGPEEYQNMWQKTRSIWAYIHDHYMGDSGFDYFYLSGDDTHLIVENLRSTLEEFEGADDTPLYLGHWIPLKGANLKYPNSAYFCGGGPGYVLNREAVRRLVQVMPSCFPGARVAAEDRFLSYCLAAAGIVGNHSVDSNGAQRFHGSSANFVGSYLGDRGYYKSVYQFWGRLYGFKSGFDIVSNHSVSFHHVKTPIHMKRHHALLYRSCPQGSGLGDYLHNNGKASSGRGAKNGTKTVNIAVIKQ